MKKYNILLVDDDSIVLKGIGKGLEKEGYSVTTAESGEEAIELLREANFDLVITDLVMGSVDGIAVLKKSKEISPEIPAIILTGYGDMESAIEALRGDADDYLLKPCDFKEMLFRISKCMEKRELLRKIKVYEEILPVCCICKRIKIAKASEPQDYWWMQMENFLTYNAGVRVSSVYCPQCAEKFSDIGVDVDPEPLDLL